MFDIFKKQLEEATWEEKVFIDYYRKNLKGVQFSDMYYESPDKATYRLANGAYVMPTTFLPDINIKSVEFNNFIEYEFKPAFAAALKPYQERALQVHKESLNPYV